MPATAGTGPGQSQKLVMQAWGVQVHSKLWSYNQTSMLGADTVQMQKGLTSLCKRWESELVPGSLDYPNLRNQWALSQKIAYKEKEWGERERAHITPVTVCGGRERESSSQWLASFQRSEVSPGMKTPGNYMAHPPAPRGAQYPSFCGIAHLVPKWTKCIPEKRCLG